MAYSVSTKPAVDGTGTPIPGGVVFVDESGAGTGPYIIGKVTMDPNGVNAQLVLANGAAKGDVSSVNGVNLGSPSAYGTSPGAVNVPGVNAFITNTVAVSGTVTANPGGVFSVSGTVAATQSGAWTVSATQSGAPWSQNLTQIAGVTLGSPSLYGTSPGAVNVPGVNAFVTNTVGVTGTVTANAGTGTFNVAGTVAATQSGTWTVQQGTPPWSVSQSGAWTVTANQGGAPWSQNQTQLNSVALGSPSAYGTAPGAVNVAGVNAFVTNTVGVSGTITANAGTGTFTVGGTVTANQGTPPWTVAQSGNWTTRIVGNGGGVLDAAGQNAPSPANELLVAGQFNTTPATITSGNVSPLQVDSAGNLLVNIKAGAGSGGTALADEGAFTEGTTTLTPIGGYFKTTPTNLTTGQAGAVSMTANRAMFVSLHDGTGVAITNTGGALDINVKSGTVAATQSGTWTVQQGTPPWSVSQSGAWTVTANAGSGTFTVGGTVAATQSGAWTVGQSGAPWTIQGDSASAATNAGNPVKVGGAFNTTQPTVTTGQTVDAQYTARGAAIVATGVDAFTVQQGTPPWSVSQSGAWTVTANQGGAPWSVNHTQLNGVALGSPSNYGTSPGAVSVAGVNAFVTNTVTVSGTVTANAGTGVFSENIAQVNGSAVTTSAAGQMKVGVVGNAGAAFDAANAATPPANMVNVGGPAMTTLPAAVANGQMADIAVDKFGRQVMLPQTTRDNIGRQTTTISTTTETTIITAGGAGVFADLLMLIVSNTAASGSDTRIDFRDTTGGTVVFSLMSRGGQQPLGFAIAGVAIPQATANTNWTAQLAAAVTDIRIFAVFAKNQ